MDGSYYMDVAFREMVPDTICAQEEDIGNEGGEAGKLGEHTVIVEAYEPVAKDARRHGVAVSEVQDGREVLQKQREECRLVKGAKLRM